MQLWLELLDLYRCVSRSQHQFRCFVNQRRLVHAHKFGRRLSHRLLRRAHVHSNVRPLETRSGVRLVDTVSRTRAAYRLAHNPAAELVRIDLVPLAGMAGSRLRIQRHDTDLTHQTLHPLAIDLIALVLQPVADSPAAVERCRPFQSVIVLARVLCSRFIPA